MEGECRGCGRSFEYCYPQQYFQWKLDLRFGSAAVLGTVCGAIAAAVSGYAAIHFGLYWTFVLAPFAFVWAAVCAQRAYGEWLKVNDENCPGFTPADWKQAGERFLRRRHR